MHYALQAAFACQVIHRIEQRKDCPSRLIKQHENRRGVKIALCGTIADLSVHTLELTKYI